MEKFEALVVNETEQGIGFGVEKVTLDDLSSGEVLIQGYAGGSSKRWSHSQLSNDSRH